MSRKTTYRQRYTNKLVEAGEVPVPPERKERIPVNKVLQEKFLEGSTILIDKPLHWTSFDVIRKMRSLIQIKKIGHAGTLDPMATGLLIVCTGRSTKKINEYMAREKEYTGTFILGAVTPTYDLESVPEISGDPSIVTLGQIHAATVQFTGEIDQQPPAFSAIKKDGVALYELARRGIDVEREPRRISIRSFEITSVELPVVGFRVVCSTGTYIRSLANDFGKALGCGAYLGSLCRTRIGEFLVEDAMGMEAFEATLR